MKPSDNEIEMLAAGFAIQHKNGLIRFAHALLEKYASPRTIAFDDWLAKHCDSDDLTAYERELAWDAWNAALSAPQASEAVRRNVVAVLAYRSKGRPGAHGQTLGANGAGEFAVVYRGDEFAAIVKANEEIRALEAAGHRLDFAAIIHGEGYSGPMLRQEYVTRAALSAQPGAQKEQSDEA